MKLFRYRPPEGNNFGDEIGPRLVAALAPGSGSAAAAADPAADPDTPPRRLLTVGSVVHLSRPGDVIWGSGINGKMTLPDRPLATDIRAVRGPLTREVLVGRGLAVPRVFGDPAILFGDLVPVAPIDLARGRTLVIPNYNDVAQIRRQVEGLDDPAAPLFVHPFAPLEVVAGLIRAADAVVTTSLHAMILADVYAVPSALIWGKRYAETPFKYRDYLAALGAGEMAPIRNLRAALDAVAPPRPIPAALKQGLRETFPHDLFAPGA